MELKWSLKELYESFESEAFKNDLKACDTYIEDFNIWIDKVTKDYNNLLGKLEEYIENIRYRENLFSKLFAFSQLTLSVETNNKKALNSVELLEEKDSRIAEGDAKIKNWIGKISNLSSIIENSEIESSELLKEHSFFLNEIKESSKYYLSDKEEAVIAKMKNTGSNAWSKLRDLLTSNLRVDIELDGKLEKLPLTVIRNMAYDKKEVLRKKAYEAELKAYEKIEDSVAACLNGIKGEVITIAKMRGYKSPLEETLLNSRMDEETLNAMIGAMQESFPSFRRYFRKKGELLGKKNGLPFYDMFAPVGSANMEFSYEQGKKFVYENFKTFSPKLAEYAKKAFDNHWIDVEPREGKVGGAFCENIHALGESRFMLNYGGKFSDVVTLAHELGHGYHGECLKDESILNSDYPMPIAETASTFCETIVKKAAVKNASKEEAFTILEAELSDCAQVIVDIYSRFLFESEVFQKRENSSLSAQELKDIMIGAQIESYGDGLDKEYLHPYMWLCKPHYYDASYNFYNFPYAFGLLFAKGLYSEYLKRGSSFSADYDKLLSVTGKMKIAEVAKLMGINIHNIEFWKNSLKTIEEDIEEFIKL
ncbi:M3 family oligoendopeptidase [Clostridium magnum]|uniref:Oligoendopeptidase F, plasmid n=1 Tax=Clostridium magnum DSM 2767 TaxID=1121326 RepID=A0A162SP66_9CLOT|nr:M3 family oligoendopeptidase [Clostridium magnum]KZL91690.1 oligoendopeptidase F, plasmid [Clostridium magnum DSM 2767]SHH52634.1 oligoendopeptidase, pepF/M3 family [Clostridium magnum DSM 2767]